MTERGNHRKRKFAGSSTLARRASRFGLLENCELDELLIPAATPDEQAAIGTRIESVLATDVGADVSALEREIDAFAHALYDLTLDEIAVVAALSAHGDAT